MDSKKLERIVVERLRALPLDRQAEVLDFVEFLTHRQAGAAERRDPVGLFADLGIDISAEDIAQARAELWGSFPRELEL